LSDPLSGGARCFGDGDPLYERYHDEEWGRPVLDERGLYERVSLEGFQSGLSWLTILRKRESFRAAFAGFDPEQVALFGPAAVERLLQDAGIVRNRQKIEATIANARALLALRDGGTSFPELVLAHRPPERPAPRASPTCRRRRRSRRRSRRRCARSGSASSGRRPRMRCSRLRAT
jgi:DNA-3-methyladenine glycosylase I